MKENDDDKEPQNVVKGPRRPRRVADLDDTADKKDNQQNSPVSKEVVDNVKESGPAVDRPRRKRSEVGNNENKNVSNSGGGWMSSSSNTTSLGKNSSIINSMEEDDSKESLPQNNVNNKDKHFQDDNDEIILIPDLDEEGGADSDQRIARAPRNVRKIPTLAELEKEVKTTASAAVGINAYDGGLNLAVLLNTLVPSSMVFEPDVTWNFETLLREVTV